MRFILLLFLLGVGSAASDASEPAASRPYWTGRIEQDTTWRDTVYVGGDVTIAAAATLTLAPNTQVLFLPYHDETQGGLDSTRAELIVEGRLHAQAGGIVFRSADAGSLGADWHGLVVERGGQADVSYAAIRDGLRCLYAKRGGRVTMDAIAFVNCGKPTAPADAAGLSTSQRRTQPLLALRVAEKTDRPKRVDRVAGKSYSETEPAGITIHIRGQYKAVISALLLAADGGTTRTGIAELDSLAAIYGLRDISQVPFFGYRFRLTFPPGADGAAMAGAYRNLSYIQSVESGDSLTVKERHRPFDIEDRGLRLLAKVAAGTVSGVAVTALSIPFQDGIVEPSGDPDTDAWRGLEFLLIGAAIGSTVGFPIGVSLVDPYDSFVATLMGGVMTGGGGLALVGAGRGSWLSVIGGMVALCGPFIGSLSASEKSRQLPQDRRISFALSPTLNGGLSAVTTLRF